MLVGSAPSVQRFRSDLVPFSCCACCTRTRLPFLPLRQRGDYVDIKCNPSIHKGMPFKYYHGRTGIVFNVTKTSLGVRVNKQASRGLLRSWFWPHQLRRSTFLWSKTTTGELLVSVHLKPDWMESQGGGQSGDATATRRTLPYRFLGFAATPCRWVELYRRPGDTQTAFFSVGQQPLSRMQFSWLAIVPTQR